MPQGTIQTVLLFLWVMFTNPHTSNAVQFSVLVPDSVLAGLGSSVILPCGLSPSYDAKTFEVHWYRNENYSNPILLYQNLKVQESAGDPQYRGRVSLIGELEKGNASLKLENVTLADSGEYMCHVEGTQWYHWARVSLAVRVVGSPLLSLAEAGDKINVTCASGGWAQKPILIWREDNGGRDLRSSSTHYITDSEGLVRVSSWLLISPSESEWISCSVGLSDQEMKVGRVLLLKPVSTAGFRSEALISTLVLSLILIIIVIIISIIITALLLKRQGLCPHSWSHKQAAGFQEATTEETNPFTDNRVNEVIYASSRSPVAPGSDEERLQVWNKLKDHKEKLTVDPDSCTTPLTVTEDGTGVSCGKLDISNLTQPDPFPPALSKEEFSSGLKYWEVKVDQNEKSKRSWCVGVTQKPPTKETLTALCYEGCGIYTSTDPRTEVPAEGPVTTLGLLLDFKHRLLSFYNVDPPSHLHTFTMENMKNRTYCALISPGSKDNHPVSFQS